MTIATVDKIIGTAIAVFMVVVATALIGIAQHLHAIEVALRALAGLP